MPVFISYSHEDTDFVDRLAANLVTHHVWVWVDRWEMQVGESFLDKIQSAIEGASALLVVLSPASIKSEWVRKELNAGLIRELNEKRVIVLPVLLRDCELPVFLRDKKYADFRTDFDQGLADVLGAIAAVVSNVQGREVRETFNSDWSIDHGVRDGHASIQITIVDHSKDSPYSVLTTVVARGNAAATRRFKQLHERGFGWVAQGTVLLMLSESAASQKLRLVLQSATPESMEFKAGDPGMDILYDVRIEARRLGTDTGQSTFVDLAKMLGVVREAIGKRERALSPADIERIKLILGSP